jgi:hypothetical protein
MRITPILLLLTYLVAPTAQAQQTEPLWALTLEDPEPVAIAAWSPTGTCVAVATDTTVHVIDRAGRPLWAWHFHETTPFLHPRHNPFGVFAVSPACDVVAIGGWSDYKYLWTADRRGRHAFLKTVGTPHYGAFSLQGDSLAVTTSGPFAYVLTPHLDVRWSGALGDLPVKWPGQVMDVGARPAAELLRQDVQELSDVLWGYERDDSVSDDGQWRAVSSGPWRGGTGVDVLELWGPGAHGYNDRFSSNGNRQLRWQKRMGCAGVGMITRDGMFVIASGDPDHPEYTEGSMPCELANLPTYVFDRDGNTVLTWPAGGNQDDMAQAVLARTGRSLAFPTWGPPTSMHLFLDWPQEPTTQPTPTLTSPDRKMGLTIQGHELRLYRQPK